MNHLSDCLDLWGFEDSFAVFLDGSLGFCFRCVPRDVEAWDNAERNSYTDKLRAFLNGLPQGLSLQFVQGITSGNSERLKAHESLLDPHADELAQKLCHDRVLALAKEDNTGRLPAHKLLVVVRVAPKGITSGRPRFDLKSFFSKSPSRPSRIMEETLIYAKSTAERLHHDLSDLGLSPSRLTQEQMATLVYKQWNPGRSSAMPEHAPEDVRSSLLFTDASITETEFSLPPYQHRVISLKTIPECSIATMATQLRRLPFDSRLFLSISVPDQQKEIETLQTQRRMAHAMLHGKRSGVKDLDSEAKLDDLETLLADMISSGEKIFHVAMNIVLRSKDPRELEQQTDDVLMLLRELGGAEGLVETLAGFDIFCSLALPNARCKERRRRFKTSYLADFLPVYGPWPGHATPSILLRSRLGSLVGFDPFASELPNANQIVSGGSGAGKSFTANILMLHMLKECPRIFVVDVGGSYRKLCETLGGQYIPLCVGGDVAINPFDLGEGQVPPSSKIKFLVSLVELMTREEGEVRLRKLERSQLEHAIETLYQAGGNHGISRLRDILLHSPDTEMKRMGHILAPWAGSSAYGQFVDRPTTVKLERPLICFDLKGLEAYPDLQAVCLLLITEFIWNEVQRDKKSKKFAIFDECWRLMENDAGSSFLAEVYRTFRKYYASAIAISQNIDDFARSRVANAIMPNASIKWILRQKGADQERLQEVLSANDREMALIDSLTQRRGEFSEAFLMAGDQRSVVQIESTPLEYWIATTDPRDIKVMEEFQEKSPMRTKLEILSALAEEYPRGSNQ